MRARDRQGGREVLERTSSWETSAVDAPARSASRADRLATLVSCMASTCTAASRCRPVRTAASTRSKVIQTAGWSVGASTPGGLIEVA